MRIVTGATAPADIVNRIAASALAGCMAHEKSFFYVRAYSRRSLAARETSAKSAALQSLTQIIFGMRRKRWLRLDGRRSIQPFHGRKLPKPRSTGAHTAVNRRAMVGRDFTTPAAPHSGWRVLLWRRHDN